MKNFKTKLSIFLSFILVFNIISFGNFEVFAQTASTSSINVIKKADGQVVNPLYNNEDIKTYSPKESLSTARAARATRVFYTKKEAAMYLKNEMVKRSSTINFIVKVKHYDKLYQDIFDMAVKDYEDSKSNEGDYLFRHWKSFYAEWDEGRNDQTELTYNMEYLSTYKQEQAVNYEVKKILDEMNVYDKDDYTKVKAVHDFITENINYDYSLKKHTAYDALITKKVVCNGYAALTYKMMKELGVNIRCITGNKNTDYHAWNIVKINNKWYNIDNTWDAVLSENATVSYNYFLKNNKEFSEHYRDKQFKTSSFNNSHPMSETSYKNKDYYENTFRLNKLQKFMTVGERFGLYALNLKSNDKIKSYKSSNPKVATVNSRGIIEAISPGVTTITAITENNQKAETKVRVRYDLSSAVITNINNNKKVVYDGKAKTPSMKVTYKGSVLSEGIDYAINYQSNTKSGKASITLYGMGKYGGTKNGSFKIYPGKVKNVKVSSTTTSTTLKYPLESGVSGYKIYRATSLNGKYSLISTVSSKTSTYTDKNLTSDKAYYYKIRAYKTLNGENLYGDYSNVLTIKTKPPGQVKNLKTSSRGKTSVKLSWSKSTSASGYIVYRATSVNGTYKQISQLSGSTKTTYTDNKLSPGKTYYYKVRAYKKVGNNKDLGSYSSKLKVTTKK